MKTKNKVMTASLLMALICAAAATISSAKPNKVEGQLAVRDVLTADISKDITGRYVKRQADVEAMNVVSDVKAQISEAVEGKRHIRFVAAIDSYKYADAKFDIVVKNGDEVVKTFADKAVTTAYTHIEADGKVLSAAEAFGDEKYNYLIAFTVNNVPESAWGYTFEASASIRTEMAEEFTVSEVVNKSINKLVIAELAGTYKGANVYNAYNTSVIKEMVIDEDGNISGTKNGVIKSFDSTTGEIVWTPKGKATEHIVYYNNGVFVAPYSDTGTLPNTDIYVFVKDFEVTKVRTRAFGDNKSRVVEFFDADNKSYFVYVNNTNIYENVSLSSISGPIGVEDVKTGSVDVSISDKNGKVLFSTGFVNGVEQALDSVCGSYKDQNNVTFLLNGLGSASVNNVSGTYKISGDIVEVFVNNEYYHLILNENICESTKPMVNVQLVTGEGHTQYGTLNVNDNTTIVLPVPEEENYVFNGWFLDAEFTQPAVSMEDYMYAVSGEATLYAKFSTPVSLTINYNNGMDAETIIYSLNDVPDISNPVMENMAFNGWYTTSTFDDGTEFDPTQPLAMDTIIYAKWDEAPIYANTYNGVGNFDNNSPSTGGTESSSGWNSASITISPDGTATGTAYPFRGNITITDYNAEAGTAVMDVDTTHYPVIYVDGEMGILVIPRYNGQLNNVLIAIPGAEHKLKDANFECSYWDSGYTKAISYTSDYVTFNLFIYDGNVHFFVSFVDENGDAVLAQDAYNSDVLRVLDKDGNEIEQFAYDGTTMKKTDGRQGTYTNESDTLILNGVDKVVVNGVEGKYVSTENKNVIGVYVNNEYFDVVLDGTTYTYNKPMVDIVFDAGEYANVDAINVNKNIEIELPIPTNDDYVFRGWYLDAELTKAVDGNYLPEENITLYARWEQKVTLTVNYGNGLENVTIDYAAGEKTAPVEPSFTNGKVFEGWYLDSEFTQPYSVDKILEDTNIYCKWVDSIELYGSYSGFEVWGSSVNGGISWGAKATNSCSLEVDPTGNTISSGVARGDSGMIKEYDSSTGYFKLFTSDTRYFFGYYNAEHGIIVINYASNIENLGNDYFVLFRDATPVYDGTNQFANSYWDKGYYRIIDIRLENSNGEIENIVIFINNDVVYYDVTFTSPTDGDISANNAYKATDLVIYDSEGNIIFTR